MHLVMFQRLPPEHGQGIKRPDCNSPKLLKSFSQRWCLCPMRWHIWRDVKPPPSAVNFTRWEHNKRMAHAGRSVLSWHVAYAFVYRRALVFSLQSCERGALRPPGGCQPCWMNFDSCAVTDSHVVSWQRRGGGGKSGRRFFLVVLRLVADLRPVKTLSACRGTPSTTSANNLPTISQTPGKVSSNDTCSFYHHRWRRSGSTPGYWNTQHTDMGSYVFYAKIEFLMPCPHKHGCFLCFWQCFVVCFCVFVWTRRKNFFSLCWGIFKSRFNSDVAHLGGPLSSLELL